MTFEELLDQAIALLQRRGRLTYRALKRQFALDDDYLEDLKAELIQGQRLAVDEAGEVLVWTGGTDVSPRPTPPAPQPVVPPGPADAPRPPILSAPAAPSSPDAERRQLTVLFCDLVDSTALASQLDPEDLRAVVRAYQATCAEVIEHFGGHIVQYLGDGLLVYFGYPQAHEDDVQRAVRSGLGIVDALGTLNTRLELAHGVRLAVRLGIHTGLVVVGEIGSGGRQEQLALGETPNIAARLQGLAAPDTVVISAATQRLVHGLFACQAQGTPALKGVAQPLPVYRVLGASAAQSRFEVAVSTGLTPLVGRTEEVALLQRRWAQVQAGQGQVVLLSGEAGIGKSRLVQVLKDQIAQEPHTQLECHCSPYHQHSALYPIIELWQRLARFQPDDTPAEKLRKLDTVLASLAPRTPLPPDTVPLLAALLSVPVDDRYPPLALTPQRQRQRTLDTLLALLVAQAAPQPLLCIVEDMHWVDPSTLELLSLIIDQVATAPLYLLLTSRPTFHPPWALAAHLTPLTLSRLAPQQIASLATQVAGGKALPVAVRQQMMTRTDGIPLFIEELTKTILESGLLREQADHYELAGPLPPLAVPATLHDTLMARLDRLATVKAVAQLGATIGRQFSYEMLQAVAQMDESTLQAALTHLGEAELLFQRGEPPHATYMFKHALIQEAAYQSLLRSTRQQYHQRIAQVLAERFPETAETQPEVVAQHYTAAGLHAQALPYWQRAGQLAIERSAHREAVSFLERGLEAVPHLPQNRATLERAVDLRLALRTALNPSSHYERILTYLREAEALAVVLDDPHRLAEVLLFLSRHFSFMGAHDQAIAAAQRALTLAPAGGDISLRARANQRLGMVSLWQGNYHQAIDWLGQTVAFLDGAQRRERFGTHTVVAASSCAWLAWCYAELGMFAEGTAIGDEGLRIAEAVNHPASLLVASWGRGLLALRHGDLPRALALLERAMGICQNADLPTFFSRIAPPLGAAYALAGRVADAVALLPQTIEQTIATELVEFQTPYSLTLGETQLLAGHLEEAHALAEGALALTRRHQERGNEAYALRLLGDIAARREPPDIAQTEAHYQQALALAGELGMRPLQAHCHHGLGTLYSQTGRAALARAALSTAIELYRTMDMTFWLPAAEAALAQVAQQ